MRAPVFAFALMFLAGAARARFAGGGAPGAPPAGADCITAAERAAATAAIARVGAAAPERVQVTLYADPMPGGINSFGRTVTNYVDLDATVGGLRDWSCGAVTYDGHTGDDIEIRDFYDMDAGVPILCAAPGTVIATHDGEFDRQTQWLAGVTANSVIVQHDDGSQALYWHLRNGSLRVGVGQAVATGDTLGMVGSSGFSSGPHLHFETQDGGLVREAYTGSCQTGGTRWLAQGPYVWTYPLQLFNSGVTTLTPSWALVCERPPSKTHVVTGSNVYQWLRLRNVTTANTLTWNVYSPLGLYTTYSFHPGASYTSSWWYVGWTLQPASNAYGAWHIDALVDGTVLATQYFALDAKANQLPSIASRQFFMPTNGAIDVDLAGTDPDGTVFWHDLVAGPGHGTATLGDTRRHLLHYVPTPGFVGIDSVRVQPQDDENALGAVATIRFVVTDQLAVDAAVAAGLELSPPAPNPAGPATRIAFTLPRAGDVRLALVDVAGRRVGEWSAALGAGRHEVAWRDLAGEHASAPGLYLVRLDAAGATCTRRVLVVR